MIEVSERLRVLYEITRKLATFTDLDDLLRFATRRARELFQAEGCALLLLDREQNEFFFPIASQAEASRDSADRLAEIRFPADRGIAGWVLKHDECAIVPDTSKDERFYNAVDRSTQMQTRALLCAPLRTRSGTIGVIEVVNPAPGSLTPEDLEFLQALASDIAIAHENASLYERLRGEVLNLRKICGFAGIGILAVGFIVAAGATFAHLAHALPVSELLSRSGIWTAAVLLVAGTGLIGMGRGWIVARAG